MNLAAERAHAPERAQKLIANQPCPYCGGPSCPFVSSTDRNRHTTDSVFHYHQCRECGLIFMSPVPADLTPFYRDGYEEIPGSLSELRQVAAGELYRMNPIWKYKKGGKLLEIGPWRGVFSCNAKDAGFQVMAIERDQKCVDFLNEIVGIRAVHSSDPAEALEALDEEFDVIAMWHVLEHLRSPWRVIKAASRHLRPGGILLVAIPNIDSYQFKVLKGAWKHLDAPRHLFFYPIQSLLRLCEKEGLAVLEVTTADELSNALSRDTWHSLANSIIPIRYARGVLARILRLISHRGESKLNAGTALTAILQRPAPE
jgi:2-polyprenyl-3-methyl-5-hydroxy-6-metoxy-1,4-benzoquinol methylase